MHGTDLTGLTLRSLVGENLTSSRRPPDLPPVLPTSRRPPDLPPDILSTYNHSQPLPITPDLPGILPISRWPSLRTPGDLPAITNNSTIPNDARKSKAPATPGHFRPLLATSGHSRPPPATPGHFQPLPVTPGQFQPFPDLLKKLTPTSLTTPTPRRLLFNSLRQSPVGIAPHLSLYQFSSSINKFLKSLQTFSPRPAASHVDRHV